VSRVFRQGGSVLWKILIVVFLFALAASVYLPWKDMREVEYHRRLTQLQLVDLYLAEKFYFQGRERYTPELDSLLSYINNVRLGLVDTVGIAWYAPTDTTVRATDMWKMVGPRERLPLNSIRRIYISPVDSTGYLLIVKDDGVSITVKDRFGFGRIENGTASWLERRRK
jgi:hypothetical protein